MHTATCIYYVHIGMYSHAARSTQPSGLNVILLLHSRGWKKKTKKKNVKTNTFRAANAYYRYALPAAGIIIYICLYYIVGIMTTLIIIHIIIFTYNIICMSIIAFTFTPKNICEYETIAWLRCRSNIYYDYIKILLLVLII